MGVSVIKLDFRGSDKDPVFTFYQKISSNLPHVVWAKESKNSLRFEIGPSYDDVPTTSQYLTDGQSSCNMFHCLIFYMRDETVRTYIITTTSLLSWLFLIFF